MIKLPYITGILFACLACKKNYTCECTTTYPGANPSTSTSVIQEREKRAKENCAAKNTSATIYGYTSTTTCTLK